MAPKVLFHDKFLKYLCGIDSIAIHAKSETTCYLLELPKYVSNILQYTTFLRECYKILINVEIPHCFANHYPTRADHWWHCIQKDYSAL